VLVAGLPVLVMFTKYYRQCYLF